MHQFEFGGKLAKSQGFKTLYDPGQTRFRSLSAGCQEPVLAHASISVMTVSVCGFTLVGSVKCAVKVQKYLSLHICVPIVVPMTRRATDLCA